MFYELEADQLSDMCEPFGGTGRIPNLRAVGNPDTVAETVKKVWHPGLRLIVNTYCRTPRSSRRPMTGYRRSRGNSRRRSGFQPPSSHENSHRA